MKYAIIESGGKQYRAVEGGDIEVDRLSIPAGEEVTLEQVLLLVDGETINVGTPTVKDIKVFTSVTEHFKGPKVVHFKYSPKKRIRVKTGHRQNYTRLQVECIGKVRVAKVEKLVEVVLPSSVEGVTDASPAPVKGKVVKSEKTVDTPRSAKSTETGKTPAKVTTKTKAAKTPAAKKPAKPTAATKKPVAKKTTPASKIKKPEKK